VVVNLTGPVSLYKLRFKQIGELTEVKHGKIHQSPL
jgi:hypothetical protein